MLTMDPAILWASASAPLNTASHLIAALARLTTSITQLAHVCPPYFLYVFLILLQTVLMRILAIPSDSAHQLEAVSAPKAMTPLPTVTAVLRTITTSLIANVCY